MLVTFSVIVSTDRYFISFVFKRKKMSNNILRKKYLFLSK